MAMKKCAKCGGSMAKMKKGGPVSTDGGNNLKDGIYGIPNAGRTDSLGFKKGGIVKAKYGIAVPPKTTNTKPPRTGTNQPPVTGTNQPPVKSPKPTPTLKPLNGRANVVLRNKPNTGPKPTITLKKGKVGGTVSGSKFAALAPPYNKATLADRIAGAKKKASKKK
jgi:hypothetical protein